VLADYKTIYLKNRYKIDRSPSTLLFSLEKLPQDTIFQTPFTIITAWNPDNVEQTLHENIERNRKLYRDLCRYHTLKATGCYEGHCEEGYLVFDIDLASALALGRKYSQYAIVYNDTKKISYVECQSEDEIISKSVGPRE